MAKSPQKKNQNAALEFEAGYCAVARSIKISLSYDGRAAKIIAVIVFEYRHDDVSLEAAKSGMKNAGEYEK